MPRLPVVRRCLTHRSHSLQERSGGCQVVFSLFLLIVRMVLDRPMATPYNFQHGADDVGETRLREVPASMAASCPQPYAMLTLSQSLGSALQAAQEAGPGLAQQALSRAPVPMSLSAGVSVSGRQPRTYNSGREPVLSPVGLSHGVA